jgi:hypothetical protein
VLSQRYLGFARRETIHIMSSKVDIRTIDRVSPTERRPPKPEARRLLHCVEVVPIVMDLPMGLLAGPLTEAMRMSARLP